MTHQHPLPLSALLHTLRQRTEEQGLSPGEHHDVVALLTALLEGAARKEERPLAGHDLSEVRGQHHVKRALEVAAAGHHNLLLIGPPGAGKHLLATTLASLLPQTVSPLPVRVPQAERDLASLVGSRHPLRLGDLTLAHGGVLFLENLAAFDGPHLSAVQQAIQQRVVHLPDNGPTFPAHVLLVATMQPCVCGWFGDPERACTCQTQELLAYHQRMSEIIASCFDLQVNVPLPQAKDLLDTRAGESSARARERVEGARARQRLRFVDTRFSTNADLLSLEEVQRYCQPGDVAAEHLLTAAIERLPLSAQQTLHMQRVARTIADLAGRADLSFPHLAEATQYRNRFGS